MDHKGDIIITSNMHIKLVGMVTNSKTTWRKNIPNQKGKSTNKKQKKNEETNDDKEENNNEAD